MKRFGRAEDIARQPSSRQRCVVFHDGRRDGGGWRVARGMSSALTALEAQVRADLARIAHPSAEWLVPKIGPDGAPALDVLIVARAIGYRAAFGLMRSHVTNIAVGGQIRGRPEDLAQLRPHADAAQPEILHRPISTFRA